MLCNWYGINIHKKLYGVINWVNFDIELQFFLDMPDWHSSQRGNGWELVKAYAELQAEMWHEQKNIIRPLMIKVLTQSVIVGTTSASSHFCLYFLESMTSYTLTLTVGTTSAIVFQYKDCMYPFWNPCLLSYSTCACEGRQSRFASYVQTLSDPFGRKCGLAWGSQWQHLPAGSLYQFAEY